MPLTNPIQGFDASKLISGTIPNDRINWADMQTGGNAARFSGSKGDPILEVVNTSNAGQGVTLQFPSVPSWGNTYFLGAVLGNTNPLNFLFDGGGNRLVINKGFKTDDATPATNTTSGAIIAAGGIAAGGDIRSGGEVYANGTALKATLDTTLRCLYSTHVRQTVSNTTNEITVASFQIDANTLGANNALRFQVLASYPNNTNNKTIRVKIGSNTIFTATQTQNAQSQLFIRDLCNRGTQNSQVCYPSGSNSAGILNVAPNTFNIDFTVNQTLTVTIQNAVSTDASYFDSLALFIY